MRTVVIPPQGVLGLGRSRTVGVVARPLSVSMALLLVDALYEAGIPVAIQRGRAVHLYPLAELTTVQEVTALRAVARVTDAPIAMHPAVTP